MTLATEEPAPSERVSRRPLLAIVAGFLLLGLLYMVVTPPFEGPDEPQHFAYVVWLAEEGRLPPQGEEAWQTPLQQEAGQPPFYYWLASLPARITGVDEPEAVFHPNPHLVGPFPREVPDNDNRAIHYPGEAQPLAGGWLAFYLARTVSLFHGALLLVAVFGLAHELFPRQIAVAWLTTLLVAAIPQVIYLSAVVSNDIAVAAWSTAALWAAACQMRRGANLVLAVALGLLFGLAVLVKVSALTLALPVALTYVWLWWRQLPSRSVTVRAAVASAATALAVAGWWFALNWLRYSSPFGLGSHDPAEWAITGQQPDTLAARWWEVFRSFWIWLGWGTVRPDLRTYYVLAGFVILALVGLVLQVMRRRLSLRTIPAPLAILGTGLLSVTVFLEIWMNRVVAPYGRLSYPVLALVALLLVLGWRGLHPRFPLVPILFLIGLALLAPVLVLPPAYAAPAPLTAEAVASRSPGLDLRFLDAAGRPIAQLLTATPLKRSVAAGDVLPVEVCLQALRQTEEELSLVVQIIGPENRLVASRHTFPGLGRYPSTSWEPDVVFCDRVHVLVGLAVEQTLAYQLEIAMLWQETGERLSIVDAAGNEHSNVFPTRVRVEAAAGEVVPGGEEALSLISYETPATWRAGETYPIVLRWGVHMTLPTDYQTFVHLRAPGQSGAAAQADGPPLDGWYPTSWWQPGEVVVDERHFALPADVTPGDYRVYVGLYDLVSGERGSPEFDLGPVTVLP